MYIIFPLKVDLVHLSNLAWDEMSTVRRCCFNAKTLMMWYNIRIVGSADKPICEQVRNVNACHRIGDLLYFICYLPPGTWVAFSDRSYAFLCSLAAFSLICSHSDWSVLWRRYTMLPVVGRYSSSWGTIWISFPFLLQNKNFQEMETLCIKYSGIRL